MDTETVLLKAIIDGSYVALKLTGKGAALAAAAIAASVRKNNDLKARGLKAGKSVNVDKLLKTGEPFTSIAYPLGREREKAFKEKLPALSKKLGFSYTMVKVKPQKGMDGVKNSGLFLIAPDSSLKRLNDALKILNAGEPISEIKGAPTPAVNLDAEVEKGATVLDVTENVSPDAADTGFPAEVDVESILDDLNDAEADVPEPIVTDPESAVEPEVEADAPDAADDAANAPAAEESKDSNIPGWMKRLFNGNKAPTAEKGAYEPDLG